MPFQTPCNFKLKQDELHSGGVHRRLANDLVNRNGCQAQQGLHDPAITICWLGITRFCPVVPLRRAQPIAGDGLDHLKHVCCRLNQCRAFPDQKVAALRTRIERGAGNGHHLPARFVRQPGRYQRARFGRGLSDDLEGSGVRVSVLRPGFVRSRMTEGMEEQPFTVDPDEVAEAAVTGMLKDHRVIWAPAALQGVFGVMSVLPGPIWRRLSKR